MAEASVKAQEQFEEGSFECIPWEEQTLKEKRQMKWHPLIIRFALVLRYVSTSGYRVAANSGFLSLPSERTLRDYTHWCSVKDGVQMPFIKLVQITSLVGCTKKLLPVSLNHCPINLICPCRKANSPVIGREPTLHQCLKRDQTPAEQLIC